jgi:hypothetical protein
VQACYVLFFIAELLLGLIGERVER